MVRVTFVNIEIDRPPLCGRRPIVADARDPDSPQKKRGLSKRIETNARLSRAAPSEPDRRSSATLACFKYVN
jgi:hypothetical protein